MSPEEAERPKTERRLGVTLKYHGILKPHLPGAKPVKRRCKPASPLGRFKYKTVSAKAILKSLI